MKKGKSTSEWDNPKNVPTLTKHPGVGVREYATSAKPSYGSHGEASLAPKSKSIQFGRGKKRGTKAYPAKAKIQAAGHEMKVNPPAVLAHTAKKFGRAQARKQRTAILLAKARKGK